MDFITVTSAQGKIGGWTRMGALAFFLAAAVLLLSALLSGPGRSDSYAIRPVSQLSLPR